MQAGPLAVGSRLSQVRVQRGWSVEHAAAQLKVPAHVVSSIENGDWQKLGAPVFVRGQLRSYARLLGEDANALLAGAQVEQWVPVNLISHARPAGIAQRFPWARALYVAVALVLMVPAVGLVGNYLVSPVPVASLDEIPQITAVDTIESSSDLSVPAPVTRAVVETASVDAGPVAAGAPPAVTAASAPSGAALQLQFGEKSWIDIRHRDGSIIERTMVAPGDQRSYASADLGRVLLGNASHIVAQMNGAPLDMEPLLRSNVARFTVSSDGSVSPVSN